MTETVESNQPAEPKKVTLAGAMDAPIIIFDVASSGGTVDGVMTILLAAGLVLPVEGGGTTGQMKAVVALKCTTAAAIGLRNFINDLLLLSTKTEGGAN